MTLHAGKRRCTAAEGKRLTWVGLCLLVEIPVPVPRRIQSSTITWSLIEDVTNEGPCSLASVVSYTNYGRNLILGVRLFIK